MTKQISFKTDYGKIAVADVKIKDDEVTVMNLEVTNKNTVTFHNRKQCSRHEWLLYKMIKNYLYEN